MILYFAYISFALLGIKLINTSINFVFRQPINKSTIFSKNIVSVLIPARNEQQNLGFLLKDLQKINGSILEIIVYDDQSRDATANLVMEFSKQDKRIKLIKSLGLPKGWLGKNHACYQLSKQAKGKYYLFIDADVRISGNIIDNAVAYSQRKNLDLLSIFPVQTLKTWGEKTSVPLMNYILLSLLPLIFVRISPFKSHSAANGQFMLFASDTYNVIKPHERFKASFVEDIEIARFYKKQKMNTSCLTGDNRIKCRMYTSYANAVAGFSKNIFMFFGNSRLLAIAFWIFSTFGFVSIIIALPQYLLVYLSMFLLVHLLYSAVAKQNILSSIIVIPILFVFFLQVMINSIISKNKKLYIWKERNIF